MKITINTKELKELSACTSGYKTFKSAHKDEDAKLSELLDSNGWDDTWWVVLNVYDQLSDKQKIDLRLLSCKYAYSCLDNFEKEYPNDNRPRLAIEASEKYASGEISDSELEAAASAARSAAWSAAR